MTTEDKEREKAADEWLDRIDPNGTQRGGRNRTAFEMIMLPFILHHANKSKNPHLYKIKDRLLSQGTLIGYDIQHIPGKLCYSCNGTGIHHYSSYNTPEPCWNCINGWYKLPQWICLKRIKYGLYEFHSPAKREIQEENPWTHDNMGFIVSERPIIEGYIAHSPSKLTHICQAILFIRYDTRRYLKQQRNILNWWIDTKLYQLKHIKFLHREEETLPF